MSILAIDVTIRYPKPVTLALLRHDNHAVIEASAGTGKTFLIEHLVVDLLLHTEVTIDQVLVVTFTEKATAELKTRIRAMLSRLLAADRDLAPETTPHWRLDAAARAKLEQALYAFGTASIFTIHGFCHRVLTEHAFQHQRLFTQSRVAPEATFGKVFTDVLRREWARAPELEPWLRQWLRRHTVDELRQLLYRCVTIGLPLRPIYDPEMLWQQVRQLQARLGQEAGLHAVLTDVEPIRMHAQTKKAVIKRIAELADTIGRCDSEAALPALIDEMDREGLDLVLDRLDVEAFELDAPVRHLLGELQALRRVCLPFTAAVAQLFLPMIRDGIRQEKQHQGWFDFDDMLALVWEGFEGPQGDMLCETLRGRYRYGLIDEFQDTDAVQWRIFRRLFLEPATPHFLYVIGDPKQSIYAFRGADVFTYLEARDAIEQVGGARVALDTNYRATPDMIDALNRLFGASAPDQHFFTGRIQYDTPVRCGHPDWGVLGPSGERGSPLHILQLMPESAPLSAALIRRAFGQSIARTIARLLQPDGALRLQQGDAALPVRARDIFILTHTASEGGEVGQYLRAEGVPYVFYKQEGLFHTSEALAICDVLAAVAAPHRAAVRIKAWGTPFFAVPLQQLAACQSLPGSHPLMQQLLRWKALGEQRAFDILFADMLNRSGWLRRELFFQSGTRELTDVRHLFEILLEETRRSGSTLTELVQTLRGWINGTRSPVDDAGLMQRLTSEPDAVQIMTMHKSKGLEAAIVFYFGGLARRPDDAMDIYHEDDTRVVDLASDPAAKARARREIAEEEQRLLYVALTRAKAQLYLPYIDPQHYPAHLQGRHRYLNMRLAHFLTEPEGRAHICVDPVALPESHVVTRSNVAELADGSADSVPPTATPLAAWQPPTEAMEEAADASLFAACRQRHAAFVVSSYSRMKQADGGYHVMSPLASLPEALKDAPSRDGLEMTLEVPDEHELPGGTMSGQFIHEVLEQLPLESWEPGIDFDTWRQRPDVTDIFTRGMRRYARATRYLLSSQRLVYAGFTTPVSVGVNDIIPSLSVCSPFRREMEFLYPIPEADHPRLTDWVEGPLTIENGYIKGYVDFICGHAGQYYVGDWKTDRLPSYAPVHLGGHIDQNYTWQLKLYALALVKMLDIHTDAAYRDQVGGILYCFLRGMAEPGADGVFYVRPSWDDILSYEDELRRRQSYV